MKDFTFDLQRFAQSWLLNGTTYTSLSDAVDKASAGDTITLQTPSNAYGNGFQITKSVIIDFGGYSYQINDGSYTGGSTKAFTTSSNANVTFQNGTLTTRGLGTAINATGSLTLFNFTTGRNISSSAGDITIKSTSGSSTGTTSIITGTGNYLLDNGVMLNTTAASTMTLTVDADKTTAVLNNGKTLIANENSGHEVEYKAIGSAITFTYDESGKASVTNLSVGNSFSVSIDNETAVTYTVASGGLQAARGGVTKVLENVAVSTDKSFVIEDLDFDDDTFTSSILTDSTTANVLTISDSLSVGDRLKVIDYNDYSKSFGYLERPNSSTYTLTKESDNNKSLSGIIINDGLTVQIATDYKNVPITVSNASTTLRTITDGDFTMSSANLLSGSSDKAASVTGAVSVSLGSGTIKIAESDDTLKPTINAGSYAVSYASGSGDGVAVIANSKSTQVSGIDKGESFNVGDSTYYRDAVGLRNAAGGVFTSDVASLSGGTDGYVSIELANLKDSIGEFVNPDSDNVLEIGKTNVNNAVIVDDKDDPNVKYAEVLTHKSASSGNLYTLRAADGVVDKFIDAVGTISLTGGAGTTIDKELVDGVKIVTSSGSKPDATFLVTDVTGDTFTVNLKTSSAATKISTDATGITLLSGTINAQAGQTITLGENGRKIAVSTSSSGMEVTVTPATAGEGITTYTATIKGAANDVFSIDGNEYKIDSNSDGMTFTVTADNVIVSDLATADKDAFTYDGATYSVRGAGFIMTKSGNHSIWSDVTDNGHSLDGGTVTIENLFADDHTWNLTASVSASDNSATLPPSDNSMKVTLIGDDFKQTYGTFTKSGTGVSLETGSSSNEAKLSKISVGSAVDNFDFGTDLASISIIADVATFIVTEDDDDGKGYQVTLTSSSSDEKIPAKVASAKRASLISGSLQSDSYFTATVLDNRIVSVGDAKVTLSTNGKDTGTSINGLKVGESFSIEGGGNYVMSKVGLVDDSSRYLPGTRSGNPIVLASLNADSVWGGLIDKDSITINSTTPTALIVDFDDSGEPVTLYADYTSSTQSFTKSNSADKWDDNIVINIDNTTVNFTSYFEDAKIAGVQSGAEFSVEDNINFTVQDVRAGAVIGSATNISQTGGKVSLISGQVSHSDAGSISADTGNLTFTVNDDNGTIAALDSGDVFTFKKDSSNVTYTRNALGLVTNDDRLFTAYTVGDSVTVSELLAGLQAEDSVNGTWTNTIYISSNILSIPPTTNVTAPWIILNSSTSKSIRYGTLAMVDGGGYSVTKSALDSVWSSSATFSINADPVTFSRDFSGAKISGVQSGAIVTVTDATGEFTFNDGTTGATITGDGSNKINQTAGLVVPHDGQTIIGGSYSVVGGSESSIAVSVSGSTVRINELSTGDTFSINGYSFEVLDNNVILRNGTHLLQNSDTSATAANLIGSSNWYGFVEAENDRDLLVNNALFANLSTGQSYIVKKGDFRQVYGSIDKSGTSSKPVYTISTDGANVDTFTSVTIAEEVESVTFVKEHFITNSIPITAGGATFIVTGTTSADTFAVNYDYSTKTTSVGTATSLTLTNGTLTLSNTAQTVTANGQTIKVAAGTITANVTTNDDSSKVVTVGSLDTANDSVVLNGETYTYVSGNGMTITVADGVTKFTNLDDDSFKIGNYTYTKTAKGFVKTSSSGTDYMWVNDSVDVSEGVDVNLLKSTDAENWKPIATITDGKITIDSSSTDTVVLVGDLTNPTEIIYGTLTVDGSARSLTKDGGANTTLTSITVDGVTVSINGDFGTVPIIPQNNATINTDGTLTFTPAVGTTFIVNDTTYTMTSSGSLTTGDKIWTSSDKKTYTLPNADAPWGVYNGTVTLNAGDSITVADGTTSGVKISVESGSITATATAGKWTSIGGLNAGDTFTIGDSTYKVLSDSKTIGLYDANGNITKFYNDKLGSDGALAYDDIIKAANYGNVLTLTDGLLDLTAKPSSSSYTAGVYSKTNDEIDPAKKVASVTYNGTKYDLSEPGTNVGDMTSISLGDVKTLTTTIYKPVTTPASGTFTINGSSFTAAAALTITPNDDGAILTSGKVTLAAGNDVTTASGTIAATTGAITVEVGDNVTIGELSNGKVFSVAGKSYTMTSIGLSNGDALLTVSNSAITVDELDGEWETIHEAPKGALTINASTPDLAAVVDLSNSSNAVRYGKLTKSDEGYTYKQSGSNKLSSITVNGTTAIIPATSATITANSATFTASGDLTVDATATIPTISASTINLTAGTINAPNDVEITVGGRKITAKKGSMTVGLVGSSVQIGALDNGDTFTVGNVSYEMTSAGLYIAKSGQLVTDGLSSDMKTYTVGDVTVYDTIVTLTNGVLDLTGTPSDGYTALVVSKTNGSADPTKKIARVSYSATGGYTLSEQGNYFSELTQVDLSEVKTFTTALETTVTTPASGTYTIKGKNFTAASALTIKTDSNGATLTSGTVSLTDNSVTTASGTVTATAGTITANVNGSAVTIGNLSNGSAFTFGGKSYTMTAIGLINDSQLLEVSGSVTATQLTGGDWQTIKQATGGNLTIGTSDGSALVVDTTANPAVKYGTLTKSDSGYTFTQNTAPTSITLNGVKATLPEIAGAIKANSATFTASGDLTVDATATIPTISATSLTLIAGTINAPNDVEITVGGRKITAKKGSMTVGLVGSSVQIGALDVGDKFTVGSVEYEMTSAGLYIEASGQLVTDGLSSDMKTYTVGDVTVYDTIVTLTNGVLDLTGTPSDGYTALVVSKTNGSADPTKKIARVSYDGTGYTLSEQGTYFSELTQVDLSEVKTFTTTLETTVTTPASGTYTIKGSSFTAASALTIKTDSNGATLTGGTVSLTSNEVLTPNGTVTATSGTITANVNGSALTIGNLSNGSAFTFGGKSYTMTAIGLINDSQLLEVSGSVTATQLTGGDWQTVKQATGGALTIGTSDSSALVVDTTANPAVKYGTLTKSDSGYTFTQNTAPTSITLNGVKATFPEIAGAIKANSATFVADGDLTVDATTSIPTITGATSLTVTAGTVNAPSNLEITVGGMKFTATNGDLTIGLENDNVVVGALNVGDKFTVGSTEYEMTSAGLYIAANNRLVTSGLSDNNTKYTVGTIVYDSVVTLDNGVLDLTDTPAAGYTAYVVSKTSGAADPTKKIAKVSYDGTGYTLSEQGNYFSELKSVSLSEVKTLTTELETIITTPESGTFTINDKTFTANSALQIKTAKDSATLTSGTVSLTNNSVTTPAGTLTATSGTITANVDGSTLTIGNLSTGDAFDFGGASYSMTSIGLSNENRLLKLDDDSVTATELTSGDWLVVEQAPSGNLTIDTSTGSALIVDTAVSPAVIYGTLTKSDSGYTFAQDVELKNITVNGVKATFPATTATVTTSSAVFTASGDFTVDDTTANTNIAGATAVTLNSGTINAPEDVEITVGSRKVTATNGDMTVGLVSGKLTIGNLIAGDTFNVGSTEYKVTSGGELYSASRIVTSFSDGTFVVDEATYVPIIEADGTNLDLTGVTQDAYVYDSATNPTKRLATLDVSGVKYQLNGTSNNVITTIELGDGSVLDNDFPATVSADGSATVNGSEYKGNGSLTIISDGSTSTLYEGDISLDPLSEIPELTSDSSTLTVNNGTVTANVVNGKIEKIAELSPGDSFDFNGTTFTQTYSACIVCANIANVG